MSNILNIFHKIRHQVQQSDQLCLCCRQSSHSLLCEDCQSDIPVLDHYCIRCGMPLGGHTDICGPCALQPPVWDYLHILADFEFPFRALVHQMKYQKDYSCALLLGQMLANTYPKTEAKPEAIIPVPLHWKRKWLRTFNQSEILAKPIQNQLNIPINRDVIQRIRSTKVQAGLNKQERLMNLKNAFQIKSHRYRHVAILDDVVTTGVTVSTLVKLLKESGCQRVDVWAICRTQLHGR